MTENKTFIAKTIAGLEELLADELRSIGAENVEVLNRAVSFEGNQKMLYKANYLSRTALRILSPLFSFQLADEDDLYQQVAQYPWEDLLEVTKTLAIDSVVSDSELTHSHYVSLKTKDAIVDRFRERFNGRRPSVELDNPDIRINIHINGSSCDVSLDSSGTSLHKRGYRVSNAEAPMSEVLAAGLILMSGWDKKSTFIDPMCGSGTLLIEAAMIANNFPAGMYRKSYGFMAWKDFDATLWQEVVDEASEDQIEFEGLILGNDISAKNLGSARANLKSARLHKDVQLSVGPFSELARPEGENGMIIINPPYGERIKTSDIVGLYREIGDTLKQHFTGYKALVISSDHYALKSVGLKSTSKSIVWNGPLECRAASFDLYAGTKKDKFLAEGGVETEGESTDPSSEKKEGWSERRKPDFKEKREIKDFDRPFGEEKPAKREFRRNDDSPRERRFSDRKDNSGRSEKRDGFRKKFGEDGERSSDRTDRPFRPYGKDSKPGGFRRNDDSPRERRFSDRKDDPGRPEKREGFRKKFGEDGERSSDRTDRPFRPYGKDSKPGEYRKKDDSPRERRYSDRSEKPDRDRKPGEFKKREDKPFGKRWDDHGDRPRRDSKSRDEGRGSRYAGASSDSERSSRPRHSGDDASRPPRKEKERKDVVEYQPQNRFSRPEREYRRKDGKVNEGDPSGTKSKEPKKKRPRKEDKD